MVALNSSNSNDVKPQADPIDLVASNSVAFETYNVEEFYKTTSVFGSSINHLGNAVLVSNDKSGIFNAYRVPVDGSPSKQLTFSIKESVFVESWFPKDERFLYSADKGGDELNHLYVQEQMALTWI
ncbi:hypothetical protein [Vibrio cyclitrophicus]|uniref:hypothetical protein n=1 Tax=Vibrio cyclitrophicus TaxID=47951 RepID=UPI0038B3C506